MPRSRPRPWLLRSLALLVGAGGGVYGYDERLAMELARASDQAGESAAHSRQG